VKTLFCRHYFSPLITSMRKGKDPEPDPDPYLWIMDPDPGGPKTCRSGSPTLILWLLSNVRCLEEASEFGMKGWRLIRQGIWISKTLARNLPLFIRTLCFHLEPAFANFYVLDTSIIVLCQIAGRHYHPVEASYTFDTDFKIMILYCGSECTNIFLILRGRGCARRVFSDPVYFGDRNKPKN
jgi:hypothetical protein